MLSLRNIHFSYEDHLVLDDVSLDIPEGEILCLLGPSGCGKTTLLRLVSGLERLQVGEIVLNGVDLRSTPVHKRGFGLMFQDFALFPHMSVGENIGYGLKLKKIPLNERNERIAYFLDLVGLGDYASRDVAQLSGGEQQRVALARCLIAEPRLLMLDEPLGALDARLRSHLMIELRDIIKQVGVTAIYVTHDQSEAFAVADRVVIMNNGMLEQVNTPINIYSSPKTVFIASFLGMNNIIPIEHISDSYVDTGVGRFEISSLSPFLSYLLLHPDGLQLNDDNCQYQLEGKVQAITFWGAKYDINVSINLETTITISIPTFQAQLPAIGSVVSIGFDNDAFIWLEH